MELDTGMENPPYFNDVYAITPDIVIVVGNNGTILKTTDGGDTWVQKTSGSTSGLGKVQFSTPEVGYILGGSGTLLKTTDAGETWTAIELEENVLLNSLSCVNENLIFLSTVYPGFDYRLLKTEDGGETWENLNELPSYGEILFVNNDIGFTWEPLFSNLFRTENGGGVWNEMTEIGPVHFLDENIGFFYSGGLYRTIDGGYNFELLGYGVPDGFMDIFVIDETTTWGILYGLLNGDGSTIGIVKVNILEDGTYAEEVWFDNNPEIDMSAIYFADENTGYIVGYNQGKGAIWKNNNGINTMQTVEGNNKNTIRIYPNPASEEINIIFGSTENSEIKLTDMTGRQLYSAEFHESKVRLDTKQFAKGIYILSVITKQKKYSQKIIIN